MHDIRFIRQEPEQFDKALGKRGLNPKAQEILKLDQDHRHLLTQLQELQNERNQLAKAFGQAKQKGEDTSDFSKRSEEIKALIPSLEEKEGQFKKEIEGILCTLPNKVMDETPLGEDETSNVILRTWGEPKTFDFVPKQHFELGEELCQMDFERAAKLSGSRFVVLKAGLARLERALAHFMLDLHTSEFGYTEVSAPLIAHDQTLYGTGLLPKFKDDLFQTTRGDWLIPTAEVVLTNLVAGEILKEEELPLRFVAHTPCFRSEAGASGRDTRGMIRLHQFNKVELVSITTPENSRKEHERMTSCAEEVLKRLNLPYRVLDLCTGDIGFQSARTYDLEVWLPGQNTYREISSCSNCLDFQGIRMHTRYRGLEGKALTPVHTLNGSGLAVGRTLVAVLENYQQEDGSIIIPDVLQPYMNDQKLIGK